MGFFSWLTADTEESVTNRYSTRGARTVHLLQPEGREPITEPSYEGYGEFGGIDVYDWLARQNIAADQLVGIDHDTMRGIGITLAMGSYYRHAETGDLITIFNEIHPVVQAKYGLSVRNLHVRYDEPIAEFGGRNANEMVADGSLVSIDLPRPDITIKLSHDANAVYENLPESQNCPEQGYFNGDDDDGDEDEDGYDEDIDEDDDLQDAA